MHNAPGNRNGAPTTSYLDTSYYGNPVSAWLISASVAIAIVAGLRILLGVSVKRLAASADRTLTRVDDIILALIGKTKFFFFLLLAVYAASFLVTLPARPARALYLLMVIALLGQIAIWGNAIIDVWVGRYSTKLLLDGERVTTITALGYLARFILWSIVLLLALDNLGVSITALVAGLGITGIAVALAVQNILGDLFSSLSIVLDKPFVLGDFIAVDGFAGHVEYIGLKTTRIRSVSGEQIVFSNADLLRSRIRNYKRMVERRVAFTLSVTYENSLEKLRVIPEIVRDVVSQQPKTRFGGAHFRQFRDFALDFEIEYFIEGRDEALYKDTQQAINLAVFRKFHEAGVEFAHQGSAHTQSIPQRTSEGSR